MTSLLENLHELDFLIKQTNPMNVAGEDFEYHLSRGMDGILRAERYKVLSKAIMSTVAFNIVRGKVPVSVYLENFFSEIFYYTKE